MIIFPNCKINLGLQVLGKRADGFHDIATVFYPLSLHDVLEVISLDKSKNQSYSLPDIVYTSSGMEVLGDIENNLCVKAYQLLKKDFPQLPPVHMHLHKAIPMGAGLGGGSADAAFCLRLLNEQFQLAISQAKLIHYALQLGSDCPFFVLNKACFATGRGEVMHPIAVDLSDYSFVVVNPHIHINTGWAFAQIAKSSENERPKIDITKVMTQPVQTWKGQLFNDFEDCVMQTYPAIQHIKQKLYDAGAMYASMTGTGSTVFGIFKKQENPILEFDKNDWVKRMDI